MTPSPKPMQSHRWLIAVAAYAIVSWSGAALVLAEAAKAPAVAPSPIPGMFPDKTLTPGKVDPKVTAAMVCKHGYTAEVRSVPEHVHKEVFARYKIDYATHAGYEVDHFVSLELGGSNEVENLWPEPYVGTYTARQKDAVENWLHREVCKAKDPLPLADAQRMIIDDWVSVYNHCCQGQGLLKK